MYRQNLRYKYMYAESTEFFLWNLLTFWKLFKDLSLESRNIQTQNCAPNRAQFGLVIVDQMRF